jgi:hypothetical protein
MSERKASGQPLLLPSRAWRWFAGLVVSLGIVMITYSVSTERWISAGWYGVLTVGTAAPFLRRQRTHGMTSRPRAHSRESSPAAFSWDDPGLKRGASIFVLVCAGIGLLGVAALLRGAGIGATPSEQDRWIGLIGGPVLAFLGFGTSARVVWRWRRRAPLRRP